MRERKQRIFKALAASSIQDTCRSPGTRNQGVCGGLADQGYGQLGDMSGEFDFLHDAVSEAFAAGK